MIVFNFIKIYTIKPFTIELANHRNDQSSVQLKKLKLFIELIFKVSFGLSD